MREIVCKHFPDLNHLHNDSRPTRACDLFHGFFRLSCLPLSMVAETVLSRPFNLNLTQLPHHRVPVRVGRPGLQTIRAPNDPSVAVASSIASHMGLIGGWLADNPLVMPPKDIVARPTPEVRFPPSVNLLARRD